jgi:hypothetical protein
MTDNKLYTVLTHFDKIEQNRLRKYIRSPYFNVNETLMDLFDMIIDYINKTEKIEKDEKAKRKHKKNEITKESLWQNLFKKEPYNDMRFRKLNSELLKLVEGYLAQEIYERKPLQQINYLFEAVGEKKIEKLYTSTESNARLISAQQQLKPADFYYYQYLIEKNYYESLDVDMQRGEKSNVEKIINYLDEFFLAEKLKWYVSLLYRKVFVSHEYNLLFIDEIIDHIKRNNYAHNPVISVYFQILLTKIDSEEEQHFESLIELLKKYEGQFPMREVYDLYSNALNYCVTRVNKGNPDFTLKFYEIYKYLLDKKIAFYASSKEELSPWHFQNAIIFSLRLGHYSWAENLITEQKDKLPKEFKENAVSYNLALVYFYQKRFDKVKELLREIEYEDITYNLGSKTMLIAIYFEQDDDELLMSLLDTFKTYLYRHKNISDNKRIPYMNLMKYIRKMLKLNNGDKKEIETIRKEIEEDRKVGIASEKWLLEKLAELE